MDPAFQTGPAVLHRRDAALIQIVDAALADATARAGKHLACRPGCTPCCHGAFAITQLDAIRLRSGLAELAQIAPGRAAAIQERASQYLAEFGPSFPGDLATGILGESPEEEAAFEDFANDAACPALDPETGFCELYAARPIACRTFGPPVRAISQGGDAVPQEGLAVCELCFTEATAEEIAGAEMAVPYDQERGLLAALELQDPAMRGETIIAWRLQQPPPVPPELS